MLIMRSEAASPEEYLSTLPQERRVALEAVRRVILENLPDGYEEAMNWGMIVCHYRRAFRTRNKTSRIPLIFRQSIN